MKYKYELMMDAIKRHICEEDAKGRKVTEVLLSKTEWLVFKSENDENCAYRSYQLALPTMPTPYYYGVVDPHVSCGVRQVTIRPE